MKNSKPSSRISKELALEIGNKLAWAIGVYWIDDAWNSERVKKWDAYFRQISFSRTDHENKDGCDHANQETCKRNQCWITKDLSSVCFWEKHDRCNNRCFDLMTGPKSCACLCHSTPKKKYLSPFTNEWV